MAVGKWVKFLNLINSLAGQATAIGSTRDGVAGGVWRIPDASSSAITAMYVGPRSLRNDTACGSGSAASRSGCAQKRPGKSRTDTQTAARPSFVGYDVVGEIKYKRVINLQDRQGAGLDVPSTLLARADDVMRRAPSDHNGKCLTLAQRNAWINSGPSRIHARGIASGWCWSGGQVLAQRWRHVASSMPMRCASRTSVEDNTAC